MGSGHRPPAGGISEYGQRRQARDTHLIACAYHGVVSARMCGHTADAGGVFDATVFVHDLDVPDLATGAHRGPVALGTEVAGLALKAARQSDGLASIEPALREEPTCEVVTVAEPFREAGFDVCPIVFDEVAACT